MHTDTSAHNLNGSGSNVRLNKLPDFCPLCHRSIHPKLVIVTARIDEQSAQAIFQCTNHSCQQLFIASYTFSGKTANRVEYTYGSSAPIRARHHSFPEVVKNISPIFCTIYNQVEHAESQKLDQMVGIGLRKALEFLVKDFAQSEHPDKIDSIQKSNLGPCIDKYIIDQNVKQCAKRAAWLGNDETHYIRKWGDKDIADLKLLVKLTVNWLENYLLTKKYIEDMPLEDEK